MAFLSFPYGWPWGRSQDAPLPPPESERTDGRSLTRTLTSWPNFLGLMGYQFFLPMVLRWRASRAKAPLLRKDVYLHVYVRVYEHDMELLILSWRYISLFHYKGSFLSFDTCSEFRWISLVHILNFKKPSWAWGSQFQENSSLTINMLVQQTNWLINWLLIYWRVCISHCFILCSLILKGKYFRGSAQYWRSSVCWEQREYMTPSWW